MLNELKAEMNKTVTENGAGAYLSTTNGLLDYFALGGALRSRGMDDIVSIFMSAFTEDRLAATRLMFYFRDIRGGQGERDTFRKLIHFMANNYPEIVAKNLAIIPEYGRWDDLLCLIGTPVEKDMFAVIKGQLKKDLKELGITSYV